MHDIGVVPDRFLGLGDAAGFVDGTDKGRLAVVYGLRCCYADWWRFRRSHVAIERASHLLEESLKEKDVDHDRRCQRTSAQMKFTQPKS